jgi:hypothetical protein
MNIDEAGRDDLVSRIDSLRGSGRVKKADLGDAAILYRYRAAKPRIARAVDDASVGDNQIITIGWL